MGFEVLLLTVTLYSAWYGADSRPIIDGSEFSVTVYR